MRYTMYVEVTEVMVKFEEDDTIYGIVIPQDVASMNYNGLLEFYIEFAFKMKTHIYDVYAHRLKVVFDTDKQQDLDEAIKESSTCDFLLKID